MSLHHETPDDETPPDVALGHERRDFSTRVVVIFGIALIVGAVVIHFLIWVLFMYFGSLNDKAYPREYPMAKVGAPQAPPAPRLQTKPREDLKQLRAEEAAVLHGYGWVDKQGGVVHIPIERAMQLLLEQGLPVRAQMPPGWDRGMPEDSSSGRTYAAAGK